MPDLRSSRCAVKGTLNVRAVLILPESGGLSHAKNDA